MSHGELTYMARVLARIEIDNPALYRRIVGCGSKDNWGRVDIHQPPPADVQRLANSRT